MSNEDARTRDSLITRFFFLWFVICNNTAVGIYTYNRLKLKKKNIAPELLYPAGGYLVLSVIYALWNFCTRYMIPSTKRACAVIDIIDEYLIVFARISLFLFFTYRLEKTFESSKFKMNPLHMNVLRIAFPIVFIGLNIAWIPGRVDVITYKGFGVYCRNTARIGGLVYSAYGVEFVVNAVLLYLFVSKLLVVTKLDGSNDSKRLINTAYNNAILTSVSMVSTWLLFMSSIIKGWPWPEMRWFWVIDFSINVWCLLLMFRLVKFDKSLFCNTVFGRKAANSAWLAPDPGDFDTTNTTTRSLPKSPASVRAEMNLNLKVDHKASVGNHLSIEIQSSEENMTTLESPADLTPAPERDDSNPD